MGVAYIAFDRELQRRVAVVGSDCGLSRLLGRSRPSDRPESLRVVGRLPTDLGGYLTSPQGGRHLTTVNGAWRTPSDPQ